MADQYMRDVGMRFRANEPSRLKGTTAAVAVGLLSVAGLAAVAAPAAQAAEDTEWIDPFDPSGHFAVYVREDADLGNTELEGSLAVGGTLTNTKPGQSYPVIGYAAGTQYYVPPLVDGDVTRLLFNDLSTTSSSFDVTGAGGTVAADAGFVKIVDEQLPDFAYSARGDFTRYSWTGTTSEQGALVDAKSQPFDAADPGASFRTEQGSVAAYTEDLSDVDFATVDACLADLPNQPATLTHEATVVRNGAGQIELDLEAGTATSPVVNYVDYADLAAVSPSGPQVMYSDVEPSIASPLVVRVMNADANPIIGYELTTSANQGNEALAASRFAMWDFSQRTDDVTWQPLSGGGRTSGSIYAPHTDMTMTFGPHDGGAIINNLVTTGGADGGTTSGELHPYTFLGKIPCGTPVETTDLTLTKTIDGTSTDPVDYEYDVTVVCKVDDAVVVDEAVTLTAGGPSVTVSDIPLGATCEVSETDAGSSTSQSITVTVDGDTSVVPGPNATIVVDGDPGENSAEITNTYPGTGSASLAKSVAVDNVPVDPADYPWLPTTVTVDITCTPPAGSSDTPVEFTVELPVDGTELSADGLPVGYECTVEETGNTDGAGVTYVPADATAVVTDGGSALVTIANVYVVTDVELTKVVDDSSAAINKDDGSTYPIEMVCTFNGDEIFALGGPDGYAYGDPMEADLADGDVATFTGLPVGAECTVTETDSGDASSVSIDVNGGEAGGAGDSVTWTLTEQPSDVSVVTVTNTFEDVLTDLDVTKIAVGPGVDDQTQYEIEVVCTDGTTTVVWGPEQAEIFAEETATFEDIPVGAECTVSETENGGADATVIVPSETIVLDEGGSRVDVVNTFAEDTGSAALVKLVSVDGNTTDAADLPWLPTTVEVSVVCTDGQSTVIDTTIDLPTDGSTVEYTDLPVGYECTVEETGGAEGATVTYSPENATVIITDGGSATVEIANDYTLTDVDLTKVVDDSGASFTTDDGSTYPIEMVCTFNGDEIFALGGPDGYAYGDPMEADLADGDVATFTGLPVGAECTVTETDSGDASSVSIDVNGGEAGGAGDSVTWTLTEQPSDVSVVTVTNTLEDALTDLTVRKAVIGDPEGQPTFTVDVLCTDAGGATVYGPESQPVAPGAPAVFTDIPVGASCTVTEPDNGDADATAFIAHGDSLSLGGDLVVADASNNVAVINRFVPTGTASLSKVSTIDGDSGYDPDDYGWVSTTVDVNVVCTPDSGTGTEYDFDIALDVNGDTQTWDQLPLGYTCTVTETSPDPTVDVTYSPSNTVEISADTPEVEVTVTNAYTTTEVSVTKVVDPSASGVGDDGATYPTIVMCGVNMERVYAASSSEPGYVPGDEMTADLADGETVTWSGLPAGADCYVFETDAGDATEVTIAITDGDGTTTTSRAALAAGTMDNGPYSVTITNAFYDSAIGSVAKAETPDGVTISGDDDTATLSVGDVVRAWDTVILDGFVPTNATVEATLYGFTDASAPMCTDATEIAFQGPVAVAAQDEGATATYSLEDFATILTVDGNYEAYSFVERLVADDGTVIAEGDCGAPSETLDVSARELPVTGGTLDWKLPASLVLVFVGLAFAVAGRRHHG